MVHGQVLPPHLVVAVMANPLLDSAVPPVGTSQAPGLFLFPSYLFIANSAEIEAHIHPIRKGKLGIANLGIEELKTTSSIQFLMVS